MNAPHLDGLNPEQRAAVETVDGPLLVLAGAGSGKTRVLTRRIAHLLHVGVEPWNVMAVTFTNKAAAEMKHRVVELVGAGGAQILVSTFHSACSRFLRRDIEHLGYSRSFSIYDDDDQRRLVRNICKDLGLDAKRWSPASLQRAIDQEKNRMRRPHDLVGDDAYAAGDPTPRVYALYDEALKAANAVDFNDLVNLVVRLWSEHPDVLEHYRRRYRYLLVDEYQDTNRAQYEIVHLLGSGTRNVMVVGDDDQSIYGFRGADVRNILGFRNDFPEARIVRLEQNYRSTGNILAAANSVVRNNSGRMEKTLWTDHGDGEKLGLLVGMDPDDEAKQVTNTLRGLVRDGRRPGDIAIIYRTNASSRAFETELARLRVPHVLVGARRFYDRREIRDVVAYLKLVVNPTDGMAFERVVNVPLRGVGARSVEIIRAAAQEDGVSMLEAARTWSAGTGKAREGVGAFVALVDRLQREALHRSPGELVDLVTRESGYLDWLVHDEPEKARDRIENLHELAESADTLPEGVVTPATPIERLQEFVDRASLSGQADELPDDDAGRVTLLTAHLAKGLEFPIVFVTGMCEGSFPHFMAMDMEEDIEEERRLVYVAITRAMERLYLTRPRRRALQGAVWKDVTPSRFLREIPRHLVQHAGSGGLPVDHEDQAERRARLGFGRTTTPVKPAEPTRPPAPSSHLRTAHPEGPGDLSPGTRVLHPTYGLGIVQRCEGSPANLKIHILFDDVGRRTVFARHAPLEIVLA